jgi:single-stranded-DNA-specific exonuclease
MTGFFMKEEWVEKRIWAPFKALGDKFGVDQLIIRLMRNRNVFTTEDLKEKLPDGRTFAEEKIDRYLHAGPEDLYDPFLMKDMDKAADEICDAVRKGRKIRVIGDYDIDGIMSVYILVNGLKEIGADTDWRIPHRVRDGYGLNEHLIREADGDGRELIITCDNGIAAPDQIRLGNELGIHTIVTDHHQVPSDENGDLLPPADAVVNPHRSDDTYPYDGLCGAGVAWKLVTALFQKMKRPSAQKEAMKYIQYAAIATVGDVMELTDENRIIVREGLKDLHHTDNPGLLELIRQLGLTPGQIDVYHIGFMIGPCLNASGRLDTAAKALNMLMTDSVEEASAAAGELIELNESRKTMTEKGTAEAVEMIETTSLKNDRVLVIFLPDSHVSVVGIIAGRIKERYMRPVFVLTETDGVLRGSGRSIEAYSMYDELVKCRDLLTAFGGHPMAAGITLEKENLQAFREQLNRNCTLTDADMKNVISVDAVMPQSYVTERLIREMDVLKPEGTGNTKPVFAETGVMPESPRILGEKRRACALQLVSGDRRNCCRGIFFGSEEDTEAFFERASTGAPLSIVYEPQINSWRGRTDIQLHIISYRD